LLLFWPTFMEYKYPRSFFSRSIEVPIPFLRFQELIHLVATANVITPCLLAATQQLASLCCW
jgi:hypothetical protein